MLAIEDDIAICSEADLLNAFAREAVARHRCTCFAEHELHNTCFKALDWPCGIGVCDRVIADIPKRLQV